MKDHEIAQLINKLRDVAVEFGHTQQLREQICSIINPIFKKNKDKVYYMEEYQEKYFPDTVGKVCPHCNSNITNQSATTGYFDWLEEHSDFTKETLLKSIDKMLLVIGNDDELVSEIDNNFIKKIKLSSMYGNIHCSEDFNEQKKLSAKTFQHRKGVFANGGRG